MAVNYTGAYGLMQNNNLLLLLKNQMDYPENKHNIYKEVAIFHSLSHSFLTVMFVLFIFS